MTNSKTKFNTFMHKIKLLLIFITNIYLRNPNICLRCPS